MGKCLIEYLSLGQPKVHYFKMGAIDLSLWTSEKVILYAPTVVLSIDSNIWGEHATNLSRLS